jgi:hypothetical protein
MMCALNKSLDMHPACLWGRSALEIVQESMQHCKWILSHAMQYRIAFVRDCCSVALKAGVVHRHWMVPLACF